MAELTPMMQQYLETKKQYPDCILFYRLGDFYEMFFEDAQTVSKELELTLTGKDCGLEERAPMCGVPYHAVEGYLSRLVQKGYKVAICEQVEDPAKAKGLIKRDATDNQVMIVARITLTAILLLGIFLAMDQNSSIFQVVSYAWAGLGASFGPLMLTSLYWRRTNKYGAIAGMLSGTATVLIWHNLIKPLGGVFAIYELLPAFIVSLLFIVVVSLLTPAPSAEVLHEFDHYLDDPNDKQVDDDLVAAEIAAGEKRAQI